MTSNFTAAELRRLADWLTPPELSTAPTYGSRIFMHDDRAASIAALREYADLLEKSRQGVTEAVVDLFCDTYQPYTEDCMGLVRRAAAKAALLAVAPLLAAMPQSGKEGDTKGG